MHCSSVAAVLQSLHQASEADESTPNFIEADPQKEKHMNQSNMGQNNIFLKKERDSSSDSFSDKNNCNSSLTESKQYLVSKTLLLCSFSAVLDYCWSGAFNTSTRWSFK